MRPRRCVHWSCLAGGPSAVRALAVETHENRLEANRYINMEDLKEHKKIMLKAAS
jgi:hypothetical protein